MKNHSLKIEGTHGKALIRFKEMAQATPAAANQSESAKDTSV